ncbi:unnamed protein product [Medioppia subpectinata]|uniref:Tetraspanin n=2 Tax=Medioppia subpectinata TaxID=1979941 RepID=A0A7R9Q038_9ACAR|nr:unnamed protein product [Medioppia subpectinata]CAG2107624.1 unnamed protein product [Medioppia subpectinata]
MAESCGGSVIKIILFVFNFIWVVCGAALIYLGIRVLLKYTPDVNDIVKHTPTYSAIVLLVAGGLIVVIAFLGCCGAIRESYCMLNTYGALILLCLAAQGVGAYLAIRYNYDLEKHANDGIYAALEAYKWELPDDDPANKAINEFQKQLQCCGAKDVTDWDKITKHPGFYPASCCKSGEDIVDTRCLERNTWDKGCTKALIDYMKLYLGSLGYIAIGVALIELLIIVMACCLSRDIKNKYATYSSPKARS